MRTEQELRQKIRELEASHQCYGWEPGFLDRERKITARAKIWGILYALDFAEEEILPLEWGEVQERIFEVVPDDPE